MKQSRKRCYYSHAVVIFPLISLQMSNWASLKYGSAHSFKEQQSPAWSCVFEGLQRPGKPVPGNLCQSCSPIIYLSLPSPDAQFGPISVTPQRSSNIEFIHSKNSRWLQKGACRGQRLQMRWNPAWDTQELLRFSSLQQKTRRGREPFSIYRRWSVGCTVPGTQFGFYWTNIHVLPCSGNVQERGSSYNRVCWRET